MKPLAGLLMLFVAAGLLLAPVPAQDKAEDKKDDKAAEKKDDEKKPEAKKDEKPEEKKPEEKKAEAKPEEKKSSTAKRESKKADPVEEKILRESFVMRARIYQLEAASGAGITVELPYPYPPKLAAAQLWFKQQLQLGNRSAEVLTQYKQKLSGARQVEVKTAEALKVRTATPPVEYDSKGNLKRWTAKELQALRGASRLPGFPAEFDKVRMGQIVELYVAKAPATKRSPAAAKAKKQEAEDEDLADYPRPEVLMIVVVMEPPVRP
jgi:hypothetical protein